MAKAEDMKKWVTYQDPDTGILTVLCTPEDIQDEVGKEFAKMVESFNRKMRKRMEKEGKDG